VNVNPPCTKRRGNGAIYRLSIYEVGPSLSVSIPGPLFPAPTE